MAPEIVFPHLGIEIGHLDRAAFNLFGISCYWYGVLIGLGILAGYLSAVRVAKKTGQRTEIYTDFLFYALIACIVGARLYYVIFRFEQYSDNLWRIFDLRSGGLAIHGAIIAAIITAWVYTKVKKLDFLQFADTGICGLLIGQAIGRFGNFTNREVFGGFTESFLAMRYRLDTVDSANINSQMMERLISENGAYYIQVHPTFLYEALWNISFFILINVFRPHQKFKGEIVCLYFLTYGVGRFWIEGLRTDQLLAGGIPVSQVVSVLFAVVSLGIIIYNRFKKPIVN